jgi:hypothetical protein
MPAEKAAASIAKAGGDVSAGDAMVVDEGGGDDTDIPLTEMALWEERWVAINRSLGQWGVLTHYAQGAGCASLLMECSWKNREWDSVRTLSTNPSIVANLEGGNPAAKLQEIYLSIADGKLGDVEKLCAQTVQVSARAPPATCNVAHAILHLTNSLCAHFARARCSSRCTTGCSCRRSRPAARRTSGSSACSTGSWSCASPGRS